MGMAEGHLVSRRPSEGERGYLDGRHTLMEKSSTELPPSLLTPRWLFWFVPSSSAIRALSCATCFSCSWSCPRCSSTFSWAMRYATCIVSAKGG